MSPDVAGIPGFSRTVQRVDEQLSASAEPAPDRERLRDQQHAVGNVLRAVARGEGLQPVLDEIVDAAVRLCHGEHGQLYLREGDVFHVVSKSGGQRAALEYARKHPRLRDRTSVVGRVALSNDVVQIADVLADPDYDYGAQAIVGFRAVLGVPIALERELIGALSIGRNVPGRFAQEQVELTMTTKRRWRSQTLGCSKRSSVNARSLHALSHPRSRSSSPRPMVSNFWRGTARTSPASSAMSATHGIRGDGSSRRPP